MPSQQGKGGSLFSKLGQRFQKAFDKHKNDETRFGNAEPPPGIENGVAQLVMCKIGIYEDGDFKGEPFFMARATIVEPKQFRDRQGNNHKCFGLQISLGPEPLCDTPNKKGEKSRKTFEEHLDYVLNEVRKLGMDTSQMSANDLEPAVNALAQQKPFFKYRTWRGDPTPEYPNPRTNSQWNGVVEDYTPGDDVGTGTGFDDDTGGGDNGEANGSLNGHSAEPDAGGQGEDLDALAASAEAEDEEAQRKLQDMAEGLGATEEDMKNMENWAAVVQYIRNGGNAGGDSGGDQPAVPEKGQVWRYAPPVNGPGGKQRKGTKKVDCDVVAVYPTKRTADLKNMADKKVYKGVSWDEMEQPS